MPIWKRVLTTLNVVLILYFGLLLWNDGALLVRFSAPVDGSVQLELIPIDPGEAQQRAAAARQRRI